MPRGQQNSVDKKSVYIARVGSLSPWLTTLEHVAGLQTKLTSWQLLKKLKEEDAIDNAVEMILSDSYILKELVEK